MYIFDGAKTTAINEILEIIAKITPKMCNILSDFRSRFRQDAIKKNEDDKENIVNEIENRIRDGIFDTPEYDIVLPKSLK